jgi:hypothetical protein
MNANWIRTGTLIMLCSFAFWTSCKTKIQEPSATQQPEVQQGTSTAEDWGLELNQGEKWPVDPPMLSNIKNMENAVGLYKSNSERDFKALAARMQQDLEELISKCTMEGKAHEELHKWLLPLMNMVAELSEAQDPEEVGRIVEEIKSALEIFHQYFK